MCLSNAITLRVNRLLPVLILLSGCAPASSQKTGPEERPNLVIIMTDQQAADAMSNRGNTYLRTPSMDYLAAQGTTFTRAYCANPLCVPSRSAMFTGRYPHQTGIQANGRKLLDPREFPSLGTLFLEAGYETGYVGKWHLPYEKPDVASHGFQFRAHLQSKGVDSLLPAAAIDFINKQREKPFLLVASFCNPHNICEWARGDALPDGEVGAPPSADECPPLPPNHLPARNETRMMARLRASYQASWMFPVGDFTDDNWREYRWAYYRMVEKVDAEIGKLIDALSSPPDARKSMPDARGSMVDASRSRADASGPTTSNRETVVIFLSDHGDAQGAHGWNQKTVLYEESARVPLIVATLNSGNTVRSHSERRVDSQQAGSQNRPDSQHRSKSQHGDNPEHRDRPGRTDNRLINTGVDLLPTLCDLAGIPVPPGLPGTSFMKPQKVDGNKFVVVSNKMVQGEEIDGYKPQPEGRMLRSDRYKYWVLSEGGRLAESLFDLKEDPGETLNLAGDSSFVSILKRHRKYLAEWCRKYDDPFPYPTDF